MQASIATAHAALLILLFSLSSAASANIFWEFQGQLTTATDPDGWGDAAVGDPASGWLEFDPSEAVDTCFDTDFQGCYHQIFRSVRVYIGPDVFDMQLATHQGSHGTNVWNDLYQTATIDFIAATGWVGAPHSTLNGIAPPPPYVVSFQMLLWDTTLQMVSDDSLPLTPPDVSEIHPVSSGVVMQFPSLDYRISLTYLPEPSGCLTAALLWLFALRLRHDSTAKSCQSRRSRDLWDDRAAYRLG